MSSTIEFPDRKARQGMIDFMKKCNTQNMQYGTWTYDSCVLQITKVHRIERF